MVGASAALFKPHPGGGRYNGAHEPMRDDDLYLAIVGGAPVLLSGLLYLGVVRRHGTRRLPAILAWNLGVALCLACLVLLGFELDYRFLRDTTDSFSMTRVSQRWFERHVRYNNWGVRDDVDYQVERPSQRRRVTFLGDSFTAGHGVEVHERFANRIRARRPDWEIHDLAANGMDTRDEVRTARELVGRGYAFDEVVLVYVLNDVGDLMGDWKETKARFKEDIERHQDLFPVRSSWFLNSLYYRWKARAYPGVVDYYEGVVRAYDGRTWKRQQARLLELREVVELSGGGHLSVVVFPFVHAVEADDFRPVHEKLGRFFADAGVPALDLTAVYAPHGAAKLAVNAWDAHPNPFAHALAAEAIVPFLESVLRRETAAATRPAGPARP